MPGVRAPVRGRYGRRGGIVGYPLERLYEEVAYIAYHFHWSPEEILSLEHRDRQRWAEEIAKINRRLSNPEAAESQESQETPDWTEELRRSNRLLRGQE